MDPQQSPYPPPAQYPQQYGQQPQYPQQYGQQPPQYPQQSGYPQYQEPTQYSSQTYPSQTYPPQTPPPPQYGAPASPQPYGAPASPQPYGAPAPYASQQPEPPAYLAASSSAEARQAVADRGKRDIIFGAIWLAVGLVITVCSFAYFQGVAGLIAWGPAAYGIYKIIKGVVTLNRNR
jgi:hypothetical protein